MPCRFEACFALNNGARDYKNLICLPETEAGEESIVSLIDEFDVIIIKDIG